jgi:spermidine/putrescine transport system permease protein
VSRFEGRGNLILIWAIAVVGLIVIYAPPFYLVAISLNPALQPGLPALSDLSLTWYSALAEERGLLAALRQSAIIALLTALIATGLSLLAALGYHELKRGRSAWFLTVILPMFVPGVIQGLALSVIFTRLGLRPSVLTVTAGHLLWAMPFAFIVILTSMGSVRNSWLMAASDLGANWGRRFLDVTLPLIMPGLISAFLFAFLLSLNEFARAFYLVGRQNTLPIDMFGKMSSGANPTIYALSGAIFAVSIICVGLILVQQMRTPGAAKST